MTKQKRKAIDLPDYQSYKKEYFKEQPTEAALLMQDLLDELAANPNMPVEVFLSCVRDIADLYGMAHLALKTKLNRESLYKSLSPKGNPTVRTLDKVAIAMGYRVGLIPINHQ